MRPVETRRAIGEKLRESWRLYENGELEVAIDILSTLAGEYPNEPVILRQLAWLLSEAGRHVEAVSTAKVVAELAEESILCSLALFHVLWNAGLEDAAVFEAKRFQAIKWTADYAEILAELDSSSK